MAEKVKLRLTAKETAVSAICPTCGSDDPRQLQGDCLERLRQCLGLGDGKKFYGPADLWHKTKPETPKENLMPTELRSLARERTEEK